MKALFERVAYALPRLEAVRLLGERESYFTRDFVREVRAAEEPATTKRRLS